MREKILYAFKIFVGAMFVVAGGLGFLYSFAIGLAIMPDCGPWLSGEEYTACLDSGPDTWPILLALVVAALVVAFGIWVAGGFEE